MRLLPLMVLLGGACAVTALHGQAPTGSYKGPIHAELLKYINVRHLQTGSSVFVRVTDDWSGLNCTLRKGAIIEAKVETAAPHVKHGRESELALSFSHAQCSGAEMAPLDLFLAAVSYVPKNENAEAFPVVRYMFSPAITTMGPGATPNGNLPDIGAVDQETLFTKGDEFRGTSKRPASLKPGEVYGVSGVTMKLDGGPHHSSMLTAKNRDVALNENTELVLVPVSLVETSQGAATAHAASTAEIAEVSKLSPAAPAPPEEFQPCAPPSCNSDLAAPSEHVSGHPVESMPLRPLGYAPRLREAITQLDDDQALAWLAPDRLLVAFNPHKLIHRDGINSSYAPSRTIRAVLLDPARKQVVSTADWELSDRGQFLWEISGDRVLVHVANELRVYDAQLSLVQRIPLAGALDFVRISPNAEVIAVAVLEEGHTPELHAKLRANLGHDPPEEVDVQILDKDFKTIAHASTTSDIVPPTLLNEGQLNVLRQSSDRYRISLLTWKNEDKTLARFSSSCLPQLSTLAPDLALVHTCDKTYGTPEVRILRADGVVVMQGEPDVEEMGQEAKGNPSGQTFALKVLHTDGALARGAVFKGSDLNAVELRVYRAADGKRLATIRAEAPAPSHDGYCISPDGSRVAVLAGGQINIFPVSTE